MGWMNTFKSWHKTQEVLIRLHILTELQLYNSFENLQMARISLF